MELSQKKSRTVREKNTEFANHHYSLATLTGRGCLPSASCGGSTGGGGTLSTKAGTAAPGHAVSAHSALQKEGRSLYRTTE